ncbi:MAG: hypothetical protein IJS63_07730 [Bacteroidaceae bacterium]|nr:hypothetical protein [Bacteroidaceae bacterium]
MKTEDIDKRIGMPDVDAEWAHFEHDVISGGTKRRSALAWAFGIGIAASVALLLIINIEKEQTEQVPLIAQTEEIKPQPTPQPIKEEVQPKEQEVVKKASTPVIAQNKRPASTNANASPTSSLDIPAREYTGAVQKPKMDDLEGLAFESVDQALQNIASADLSSGTTMRLRGTGDYRPSDKDRMDSTLILVNGEPLPEYLKQDVLGNNPDDIDTHMPRYFSQQGLMIDSVYVHKDSYYTEKYGGLAKYGVIEIKTVPDNQEELLAALPDFVPDENEVRLLPLGAIGGSHDSPPNDSILYLINGMPQPKENNKWLGKMSYLDYFKRQHLLVDSIKRNMNEEAKQRFIEKYGEAAKHGVVEYFCVEDTLCDYYMNQHEELKASRRRVSGVVLDENDEPLDHTMINIWHEKRVWGFETTDSLGNFTFWVPRTDVKLEFTYVGFYKAVVVEPSDTFQTIYLLPNDNLKSLRKSLKF